MTTFFNLTGTDEFGVFDVIKLDNYTLTDLGFFGPGIITANPDSNLNPLQLYVKHLNQNERDGASGTGLFAPFLRMNGDATLQGFNTDAEIPKNGQPPNQDDNHLDIDFSGDNNLGGSGHTVALKLGDIPIIYRDLNLDGTPEAYYQINLDMSESSEDLSEVSLEELQIYTSPRTATLADYQLGALSDASDKPDAFGGVFIKKFDLDSGGVDRELTLKDVSSGQGGSDYEFYIPVAAFAGSSPDDYITLYSQFGPDPADNAGFTEWKTLRSVKIIGTKFNDVDGDGVKDAGDNGLPGFTIYIDQNGNNKLDVGEMTALTDVNGNFTFYSLLQNASYTIREVLTSADVGVGVTFTDYDPPNNVGLWSQTTGVLSGPEKGDQVVNVGTSNFTGLLVGNHLLTPNFTVVKSAAAADGTADTAGEAINFLIVVDNTGEVALTGVTVTDAVEGRVGTVNVTSYTGDTNNDGKLDTNEIWTYTGSYALLQSDLDSNGVNNDGKLTDTASVDTAQTDPAKTATADVPLVLKPNFSIGKSAVVADGAADKAGDIVNYTITLKNTGNVALSGVTVSDKVEAYASVPLVLDSGRYRLRRQARPQ